MRYDDASQTGSTGHSEPVARPDEDRLPAGSYGPAGGNAITGQGTTSGASGADSVSAAPATIVAVQGAGGQTVTANGSYQAAGQFGVLSMDMQGNFNYVRNPGTPDGVKDVFNYTLADAAGAHSSTTLTIDIGQIAAAAAGQGVVSLPAGVELSDIHVNGRDLIVNMPDGTQMVIPGGAVFVPQIVIGDVQVPPTNLAALLIDSEPQPAAGGEPLSSGGNFADPVPPLDPGVPLGDLIPPTELTYTPPEFREIGQIEDVKPTVIIETPDNPAGAVDASESVNEKGLPARDGNLPNEPAGSGEIADGNGTNNSDPSETNTGTIVFTAPDGLQGITVNGVAITAGSVGSTIQGQFGTMTITAVNLSAGTITYSYTLADNTSGDNTADHFTVVVTDSDGDTATGTLTVHIIDDVPTARNDTDTIDLVTHIATGNVVTGADTTSGAAGADTVGADNAQVTAVSGAGGSDSTFVNGALVVAGQFGTLTIHADGSYSYQLNDGAPGGSNDVFTYTLTDGDGDTSTATLTINNPDHTPTIEIQTPGNPAVVDAVESVNEKGLPPHGNGLPAGSGEIADGNPNNNSDTSETNTGTIIFNSPDGVGSIKVNGTAITAVGQVIHGADGDMTITSIDLAHGQIGYSYTLTNSTIGDNTHDDFSVVITDTDGDTATSTLRVNIIDDVPTARADTDTTSDDTHTATGNVITGADTTSGAAGADTVGADNAHVSGIAGAGGTDTGADSSGNFTIGGRFGTLVINQDGTYTYTENNNAPGGSVDTFTYTLTDGDGDSSTATLTITNPNHTPTIEIQTPDQPAAVNAVESVDEKGLPPHGDGLPAGTGEIADGIPDNNSDQSETNTGTILFNSPDGVKNVTVDGTVVDHVGQQIGGQFGTMTITSIDLANGQIGYSYTLTTNTSGDDTHDDFSVVITDTDGDQATATLRVNIIDDTPIAVNDGNLATLDDNASGVQIGTTATLLGNDHYGADGPAASGSIVIGTGSLGGTVTIDGSGNLIYTSNHNTTPGNSDVETFTYTIKDGDGDTTTATFTVTLTDTAPGPGGTVNLTLAESGLDTSKDGSDLAAGITTGTHPTDTTETQVVAPASGLSFAANSDGLSSVAFNAVQSGITVTGLTSGYTITWSVNGSGQLVGDLHNGGTDLGTAIIVQLTGATGSTAPNGTAQVGVTATLVGPLSDVDTSVIINGIDVVATQTDNDTSHGTVNITVTDDTPLPPLPADATLTNDSSGFASGTLDTADNTITDNAGADGGFARFASTGFPTGLTSGGVALVYTVSNGGETLTATAGANGPTVFVAEISGSGYTIDMSQPLDSNQHIELNPLSSGFIGGNDPWAGFNLTGPQDILLTPMSTTGVLGSGGNTLNTSNILLGVGGGQQVDVNEGVRMDFVNNIGGDPAKTGTNGYSNPVNQDHTFDSHYTQNGASMTLTQESGSSVTAEFQALIDPDGNTTVGDGALQAITGITLTYFGVTYQDPVTLSQIIVPTTTPTPYTISGHTFIVVLAADGKSVDVTGIDGDNGSSGAGTEVAVFTAHGYTTLDVLNVSSDPSASFKIGSFGVSVVSQDPVHFNLPVEIVDGDGDVSTTGLIHVTATQPAASAAMTSAAIQTMSTDSTPLHTSSLVSSNDNTDHVQQRAFNVGGNAALMGALAAAGLEGLHDLHASPLLAANAIGRMPIVDSLHSTLVAPEVTNHAPLMQTTHIEQPLAASQTVQAPQHGGPVHDMVESAHLVPQGAAVHEAGTTELLHGSTPIGQAIAAHASAMTAAAVAMPSAQQLAAIAAAHGVAQPQTSVAGQTAQHDQVVSKVLVDALHGGDGHGPNIDALINGVSSQGSAHDALQAFASHAGSAVPFGHMGFAQAFGGPHLMLTSEALMVHQDAAPPAHG